MPEIPIAKKRKEFKCLGRKGPGDFPFYINNKGDIDEEGSIFLEEFWVAVLDLEEDAATKTNNPIFIFS